MSARVLGVTDATLAQRRTVRANDLDFEVLELGTGPLALCLHGFPDSAHTWRYLLPALAAAGFHAVAPFMRGYAPTATPADGCSVGALVADACELHDALEGDEQAVLIGNDWGADAAYGAAAFAPERWRRVVTLSQPPAALDARLNSDYDQLKRFFYAFFLEHPASETVVAAHDMAFLERLWDDWSPDYDAQDNLKHAKACLRQPDNLRAAIEYYRATPADAPSESKYEREQAALTRVPPQPILYMHGDNDGCIGIELVRDATRNLAPGSRMQIVHDAGHFLQVEKPKEINEATIAWVTTC
jgi:pimeloyl-ACP methyl ester carboxylesterase